MPDLLVLATESGISYESPLAKLAVPIGIAIFLGLPYMLLRSNLGTLRAYLVIAASFFGFMTLLSLFWAFGAPGTPAATGPTNLPGQPQDEYQPIWVPFAEDSLVAEDARYADLVGNEGAFSQEIPEAEAENIATGVNDTKNFFSASEDDSGYPPKIDGNAAVAEGPFLARSADGQPVILVTYGATYQFDENGELPEDVEDDQVGTVIPDGEEGAAFYTAYAFFDAGNPVFPSMVFFVVSLLGFLLHALLLYRDEQKESTEDRELEVVEQERVPAGV